VLASAENPRWHWLSSAFSEIGAISEQGTSRERSGNEQGFICLVSGVVHRKSGNTNTILANKHIVEVAHSWFNRFRKLLVRYEKLERSFVALNYLAAAIIVYRKVPMKVNVIYG
jgi:hypothetical protein